jgi:hypothetical protein
MLRRLHSSSEQPEQPYYCRASLARAARCAEHQPAHAWDRSLYHARLRARSRAPCGTCSTGEARGPQRTRALDLAWACAAAWPSWRSMGRSFRSEPSRDRCAIARRSFALPPLRRVRCAHTTGAADAAPWRWRRTRTSYARMLARTKCGGMGWAPLLQSRQTMKPHDLQIQLQPLR